MIDSVVAIVLFLTLS